MGRLTLARSWCVALVLAAASVAGSAQDASEATVLVRQLGQFQAEIDGRIDKRTGQPMPVEQRREAIYVKLRILGGEAIPALQRGLTGPDVQIRRNVALYLSFEGGNYAKHAAAALDVTPFLPQLVVALRDDDELVTARAAQALAHAGSKAAWGGRIGCAGPGAGAGAPARAWGPPAPAPPPAPRRLPARRGGPGPHAGARPPPAGGDREDRAGEALNLVAAASRERERQSAAASRAN